MSAKLPQAPAGYQWIITRPPEGNSRFMLGLWPTNITLDEISTTGMLQGEVTTRLRIYFNRPSAAGRHARRLLRRQKNTADWQNLQRLVVRQYTETPTEGAPE